jgi:hypothetical protein
LILKKNLNQNGEELDEIGARLEHVLGNVLDAFHRIQEFQNHQHELPENF